MAGKGGYQAPRNPAPVSGPGKLSKRTDGGPGSKQAQRWVPTDDYGGATEMQQIQQGAPMRGDVMPAEPIPFNAPTQRPDEPITAGAPFGPGPGPDPRQVRPADDDVAAAIRVAYSLYPSPQLAQMVADLDKQGR